ncbi:transporter substrate-binding domain-containing protein [Nocardioides carbamazepini]|uniref:transporter substrate-binding domain-containing protein n=1 Tax=Nocardioides carbamazepini TaxID=2854259 RepID=UPI00214A4593|nr:transporter substrate-binding domain-containing protein [Nocardioides carbamazepini]MCR1785830.1 transporter substrate-binding domain-containing protein [Nocardioides carbamazepini]
MSTAPWSRRSARLGVAVAAVVALSLGLSACGSDDAGGAGSPPSGASEGTTDLATQPQLVPDFEPDAELVALLPQEIRDAGSVATATSVGLAPINFPGADGDEVKGLNADLIAAVEQLLGLEFDSEIYPSTAAQLLALDSGRVALTTSTNGDTAERQQKYDFVDTLISGNVLLVAAGNPQHIEAATDVCGRAFGEVKGSFSLLSVIQEVCADAGLDEPELSTFDDVPAMQLALTSGRIDTYIGSDFSVVWDQSQGQRVEAVELPEAGDLVLGWTLLKGNDGLRDAVAGALQRLVEDGYYDEAFERWGLTPNKIAPGVNVGDQASGFGA